jgi:hypothetical protein
MDNVLDLIDLYKKYIDMLEKYNNDLFEWKEEINELEKDLKSIIDMEKNQFLNSQLLDKIAKNYFLIHKGNYEKEESHYKILPKGLYGFVNKNGDKKETITIYRLRNEIERILSNYIDKTGFEDFFKIIHLYKSYAEILVQYDSNNNESKRILLNNFTKVKNVYENFENYNLPEILKEISEMFNDRVNIRDGFYLISSNQIEMMIYNDELKHIYNELQKLFYKWKNQ